MRERSWPVRSVGVDLAASAAHPFLVLHRCTRQRSYAVGHCRWHRRIQSLWARSPMPQRWCRSDEVRVWYPNEILGVLGQDGLAIASSCVIEDLNKQQSW